jgi:hypothetical protein
MKLVSLLCLILGTACLADDTPDRLSRAGTPLAPNAPDLEASDQPEIEPNAPDAVAAPRQISRDRPSCLIDDDCAADEACNLRRCERQPSFEPGSEPL